MTDPAGIGQAIAAVRTADKTAKGWLASRRARLLRPAASPLSPRRRPRALLRRLGSWHGKDARPPHARIFRVQLTCEGQELTAEVGQTCFARAATSSRLDHRCGKSRGLSAQGGPLNSARQVVNAAKVAEKWRPIVTRLGVLPATPW